MEQFAGQLHCTGWDKNRTVLKVDNFATVRDRKACDMKKVSKFCLENSTELKCE